MGTRGVRPDSKLMGHVATLSDWKPYFVANGFTEVEQKQAVLYKLIHPNKKTTEVPYHELVS